MTPDIGVEVRLRLLGILHAGHPVEMRGDGSEQFVAAVV